MKEELLQTVRIFISKFSGISETRIFENSNLEEDLNIYGEDAVELINIYGKEFSIDVSKFLAADYFSDDGGIRLQFFMKLLRGKRKIQKKTLTVAHLVKGIISGRLDEEVISN